METERTRRFIKILCHPGESRDPFSRQLAADRWIPAFAGMTWTLAPCLHVSVFETLLWRRVRRRWWRRVGAHDDRCAVLQLDLAGGDDTIAGADPGEDGHLAAPAGAGLDRRAERLDDRLPAGILALLADHIDAVAVEPEVDRRLGQDHPVGCGGQHQRRVDGPPGPQR